jgi:hypothetical protein
MVKAIRKTGHFNEPNFLFLVRSMYSAAEKAKNMMKCTMASAKDICTCILRKPDDGSKHNTSIIVPMVAVLLYLKKLKGNVYMLLRSSINNCSVA